MTDAIGIDRLSIGCFGDKRDGVALPLLVRLLEFLHLNHPLHYKLILALLISVALVLALPWQVKLRLAALVKWNEQVCALVSIGERHLGFHHFFSCCNHGLRWSLHLHLQIGDWRSLSLSPSLVKPHTLSTPPIYEIETQLGVDSSSKPPRMDLFQCYIVISGN